MATEAQVRANAQNAQRSTGPQTDEGKAAAARNALRHGLCSAQALLPEEDDAPLAVLRQALRADLKPRGPMEDLLFERIVAAEWRLRRAMLVECGIFERTDARFEAGNTQKTLTQQLRHKFQDACLSADALGKLSRYENSIERGMIRALTELRRLQEARLEEEEGAAEKLRNEPNSVISADERAGNGAT
jgi:hypothetical protein